MRVHPGLADRAAAARQRLLQHRSTGEGGGVSQLSSQQAPGSQRRGGRGGSGTQQGPPASLRQVSTPGCLGTLLQGD